MQELGNAINESLSDSDRIASAIGEIKRAGYDVFLVLEATIGFNKRDDAAEEVEDADVDTPAELIRMAEWLQARGVRSVAMESTGVYWIPPHEVLEAHGRSEESTVRDE